MPPLVTIPLKEELKENTYLVMFDFHVTRGEVTQDLFAIYMRISLFFYFKKGVPMKEL